MHKVLIAAVLALGVTASTQPAQASWLTSILDIANAGYCNGIGNVFRVAGNSKKWGDDFVDACTEMWY